MKFIPVSGPSQRQGGTYVPKMFWRITTILSLLVATALGFTLFERQNNEPAAFHILFLFFVVMFLFGLLNLIRDRIEGWIRRPEVEHEYSQVRESRQAEPKDQLIQTHNQDPRR